MAAMFYLLVDMKKSWFTVRLVFAFVGGPKGARGLDVESQGSDQMLILVPSPTSHPNPFLIPLYPLGSLSTRLKKKWWRDSPKNSNNGNTCPKKHLREENWVHVVPSNLI